MKVTLVRLLLGYTYTQENMYLFRTILTWADSLNLAGTAGMPAVTEARRWWYPAGVRMLLFGALISRRRNVNAVYRAET